MADVNVVRFPWIHPSIIVQSFFPNTDVNMSAMVIRLHMKKLTIDIAENEA